MCNTEMVNSYCLLVNKLIWFIEEHFEGIVPAGHLDQDIYWSIKVLYDEQAQLLDEGKSDAAKKLLQEFIAAADTYFEQGNPWKSIAEDRRACRNTVLNTLQMVANLTVMIGLAADFAAENAESSLTERTAGSIPENADDGAAEKTGECPAEKVRSWLQLTKRREVQFVHSGYELPLTEVFSTCCMSAGRGAVKSILSPVMGCTNCRR